MSAAGWYRDPTGRYNTRYWDGQQWTDTVNSGGANTADPIPADMKFIQPAPGTAATATQPASPAQPTMQVTQSSSASAGTVVAVVISVIAVLLVVIVLFNQSGDADEEPDTTEPPVTTEAPAPEE